jgi:phosphoglycolate phosphatase
MKVEAVLFDLDGTLVDSAPDLAGTANDMRAERGLPPLPLATLRPHCGSGARGMLGAGLGVRPGDADYTRLRDAFLDRYEARMLQSTQPFDAALRLLHALDAQGLPWGIVTNKALRFAEPLCRELGLLDRAAVLVGGDSTPHTKPHPAPLLEAARRLNQAPAGCIYVGDDARDMHAGRAAGMRVLAAGWGYLGEPADPALWQADALLAEPLALLKWLDLA